jgi:hypothetical protein
VPRAGAILVAVTIFTGLATGFHQPPTAPPPVGEQERPLYKQGSRCYKGVTTALSAIGAAGQAGNLDSYRAAAEKATAAATGCVPALRSVGTSSKRGACAKTLVVKAFQKYGQAGRLFTMAAEASASGDAAGAQTLAAQATSKLRAADSSLTKADGILRHKRGCPPA